MGRFQAGRGGRRGRHHRGGRGHGAQRPKTAGKKTDSTSTEKKKKTLADNIYYLGSAKQASDYVKVTNFITDHIKATFEYGRIIAEELKTEEPYDIAATEPKLQQPSGDKPSALDIEEAKIKYRSECDRWVVTRDKYKLNREKAAALLWKQCSSGMQHAIKGMDGFATKIEHDPSEMKKAIRKHT